MTANKKELSERDICTQFILPALVKAGWDVEKQVREEVFFTDGRIFVKVKISRSNLGLANIGEVEVRPWCLRFLYFTQRFS